MASTYSNLGIELMATGEQAGVWGTTTNRNLEMIEQAIGGVATIAITGSTTSLSIPQDLWIMRVARFSSSPDQQHLPSQSVQMMWRKFTLSITPPLQSKQLSKARAIQLLLTRARSKQSILKARVLVLVL